LQIEHPDSRRTVPFKKGGERQRDAWSVDCARTIAAAPDWLLAKITEYTNGNGQATPPAEWRGLVAAGVDEG
jgi:hypothetical protein